MSKNAQNTNKNVEKLLKYRPKCPKTVKRVEKSLKTAKNIEKAKKGRKLENTEENFGKTRKY